VSVAAQDIENPGTYSKTPFGILGSGVQLVGDIVNAIPLIADMIPFDIAAVTGPVGGYLGDIFYVVSARLWDPWGEYAGEATLPDVVIDAFPPGIDLKG